MNPDTASAHFKLVLKQNKLPIIKFHELRHSCASLLLEYGVGMKEIQEWLGHSTYNTTADIYSHLNYTSKLNVANILESAFDKGIIAKKQQEIEKEKLSQKGYNNFELTKPRHLNSFTHRERTKTQEFDLNQTPNDFSNDIKNNEFVKENEIIDKENQVPTNNNDIDDEIENLEKLLAEKRKLKKQFDDEM